MTTTSFDSLIFNTSIYVRNSSDDDDAIETLAASIKNHGILVPLTVRSAGNHVEIIKGGRRWRAIQKLIAQGDLPSDTSIPVHFVDAQDDADARERALAASIERTPLHPVDQFEAFASLRERYTPAEIASRFGVTERFVKQRIALGDLHPDIRSAWRQGEIEDNVAEAFTATRDQDRQIRVFSELDNKHYIYAQDVRAALGMSRDAALAIKVVGVDAYTAAGGHVTEDLFNPRQYAISDPELAARMLADVIDGECKRLVADGWSFALPESEIKDRWKWTKTTAKGTPNAEEAKQIAALQDEQNALTELAENQELTYEQEARVGEIIEQIYRIRDAFDLRWWTPARKKKLGCFVTIEDDGEIAVSYGYQRPTDPKAEKKNKKDAGAKSAAPVDQDDDEEEEDDAKGPEISQSLQQSLREQLTVIAANTLKTDPRLALRAAVTALDGDSFGPVRINKNGLGVVRDIGDDVLAHDDDGEGDEDFVFGFSENFARVAKITDDEVLQRMAVLVARSLNLSSDREGSDCLIGCMDRDLFEKNARETFDAEGYFKSVSVDICNAALDEMGVANVAGSRPKKKADLVKMCVDNARHFEWLPQQLRYPEK